MSFFEILLDAGNARERKKKQACAILIAITAILLVIAIIAFVICQVVDATAEKEPDDKETQEAPISIGATATKQLSEEAIYSGNLLTLNDSRHYKGRPELLNVESQRKEMNAFISLFGNKANFMATADTVKALCNMVTDCNKALDNDDNLVLSGAYDSSAISTQSGIYSSGEAVAISCCFEGSTQDIRPINEVAKYKWIYNNAHKYGFIAASANSNVFRYVGVTHATAAKANGLYLDNYLKQLKNATAEAPMKLDAMGSCIAYTCPIANVVVPTNYSYEISGNNVDGVIVTVNLKSAANAGEIIE